MPRLELKPEDDGEEESEEAEADVEIALDDANIQVGGRRGKTANVHAKTPPPREPRTPETPALSPKTPDELDIAARRPPSKGRILRAPRWSRFVHYGMHAFLGLLILILLITLILIELDAKDGGEDGIANQILSPFGLQLDGGAGRGTGNRVVVCESGNDGSGNGANGYVQAGIKYHQIVEDLDRSLDEADVLFAPNVVFYSPTGTLNGWPKHKTVLDTVVRPRWALEREGNDGKEDEVSLEVTGFPLTPTEVIVQVQARTKEQILHSYFTVVGFDANSGLIVSHTVYPSLSFVLDRVDAAKAILAAFDAGREGDDREFEDALAALDGVLADDFVRVTDQSLSVQGREDFKRQIRSSRENRSPDAPEVEVDREFYATGDFVSDRWNVYLKGSGFNGGDEGRVELRTGYTEFEFDKKRRKIKKMQSFQTDFITKRGENAIKFHEILNATVSAPDAASRIQAISQFVSIVDENYNIQNSDGQIYDLKRLRDLFGSAADANPMLDSFLRSYFSSELFTQVEYGDAVYVIWHNRQGYSPLAIHHFKPGTATITDTYISPVYYAESPENGDIVDVIGGELSAANAFIAGMRVGGSTASSYGPALDPLVSDDFSVYAFFGGDKQPEDIGDFKESLARVMRSYTTTEETERRTLSDVANPFAAVKHAMYYEAGKRRESVLDIFYFDPAADDPTKIKTLYLYNQTAN